VVSVTPKLELVYMDRTGSTAALTMHIPVDTTETAAFVALDAMRAAVASLTGCALVRARITYKMRVETPAMPDVGASIKRRAVFFLSTPDDGPLALVEIPGVSDSIFISDGCGAGQVVDTLNLDVAAFVAALLDLPATNPFGDEATELMSGNLQSRV